ncbi:MAG: DUF4157 domain-containing protein [Stenomitos frigidus ULC029]
MQTRSSLQRRSHSESSDRLVANIKPRSWSDAHQQQATHPQPTRHDFSHVDLFAHDPGTRTINFGIQPKLTVGAPNDVYEQEADRVAEQVMSLPDTQPAVQREGLPEEEEALQTKALGQAVQREAMPEEDEELQTKPLAATITPLVQREALPEEEELQTKPLSGSLQREALPEEEEELQTKSLGNSIQREAMPDEEEELQTKSLGNSIQREALPEEEEELQTKSLGNSIQREAMPDEEEELQTKRSPGASFQAGSNLESRLSSSQGGGNPLPQEVRSFMEPRFGADFSQVRVHTGNEAVQMNQDLSAQAFTHKQDVYFGAGKSPAKDALTAHELTHVVQQTGTGQKEFLQREDEDENQSKVVDFDHELELKPIELKDKDGKIISTQSVNLELSLNARALYTAKSSKVKFSFGQLKLATVLGAVSEEANAATNTTASVGGGISLTIFNAKLKSPSLFLPAGSTLKFGGKLEGTVNIFDGKLETKIKPKIGIKIPLSKKSYLELEAVPGVEYGGKLNLLFD